LQNIFGQYTESSAFERPLTSGVAYALKVLHSDRMHFEKQHGWTIKKMEAENEALIQDCIPENLDLAPIQDEYAPVIFAQETISHIVSIDMMSGKVCLSSLVITPRPITLYFLQSYFEAVP
jgi:histidine kinase 2/3/4 (cytokinin receptor)